MLLTPLHCIVLVNCGSVRHLVSHDQALYHFVLVFGIISQVCLLKLVFLVDYTLFLRKKENIYLFRFLTSLDRYSFLSLNKLLELFSICLAFRDHLLWNHLTSLLHSFTTKFSLSQQKLLRNI